MTVSNSSQPARLNSIDFARFLAASAVIFSHHFPIAGRLEPNWHGLTLGDIAVQLFFLMSGYLIARSLTNDRGFSHFVAARALRIVPNLFFALAVTSIVTLIYFANYSHGALHLRYVAQNLAMLLRGGPLYEIAGVFQDRPERALNGSLWTLPYEVWCYFILFFVMQAGPALRRPLLAALPLVLLACALWADFYLPLTSLNLSRLGMLGIIFFIGANWATTGWALPILSSKSMAWFGRWGDPSYGMYIFAWPVQQFCTLFISSFWPSMLAAFVLTTLIGYCTWHGFEKRALAHVTGLARWLRQDKAKGG